MKRLLDKLVKNPVRAVWKLVQDWWLDKHKLRFKSYLGNFAVSTPVVTGSRIRAEWRKKQTGAAKFHDCPGMLDFANSGYIITAHTDIRIVANKVGNVIDVRAMPLEPHLAHRLQPAQFDFSMVAGLAPIGEDAAQRADKIHLPWTIQFPEGYSAYVLPATMHCDFLDKIFIYPGVVHFDKYHTINMVFSAIKECDFIIKAGDPLLHILPFKREEFVAVCDKATPEESERHMNNMPSRAKRYYRRFLADHKPPKMECPYNHRGQ